MRFSLPALDSTQSVLARKPEIGVESSVRISALPLILLGTVATNAAGTAAWKAVPGVEIPTGGMDLHLRCNDSFQNLAGNPSVTLNVTLVGVVGAATAVAAFAIGSWWDDQSKTFPIGTSQDFVGQGGGNSLRLVSAISGISASANLPANAEFSVWGSPTEDNFTLLGYKRNASGAYQVPGSVAIPDGYLSAGAVKKGRSKTADLTMEFVHISAQGGMARYNGSTVSALIKVVKDKTVYTENVIYAGYRPEASPARGDGDDEVKETSAGPYEAHLLFTAP